MGSLKGDRAAQRKRRLQDIKGKKEERTPRMSPNVRIRTVDLKKLEDILDEDES